MIDQKQYLAVKLGIDVHADSYVVVRQVDGSTPQTSQKFRTRESFLRFVSKQQSEAEQVYACYEAGPFGWSRFNNRRQVSSYTGLCPSEHSSGKKRRQGHITKHGNPRVRAKLVECAWRLVRYQPDYPPIQKFRAALLEKKTSPAARKKAIVAVTRRLAVDLWRLFTEQTTPEQIGLLIKPSIG